MCLTAASFCTAILFRKGSRTVHHLTQLAVEANFDFRDYDIRRALKVLVLGKFATQAYGKRSTKLVYTLTTKGRNLARRDRKMARAAFGTLEKSAKTTHSKGPQSTSVKEDEVTGCTYCGSENHVIANCDDPTCPKNKESLRHGGGYAARLGGHARRVVRRNQSGAPC
jgi:hypothetical protein